MINAKDEFLVCAKNKEIKCAIINTYDYDDTEGSTNVILKENHNEEDFKRFLDQLDFEYDNGYGSQELFGIVWLKDGTWLDRWEYDGSESWKYNIVPEIPQELKG